MINHKITPLKAIRRYCLWCCNDQSKEVRLCPSDECVLYLYRLGKKGRHVSLVKTIRQKCLDCHCQSSNDVFKCDAEDCPLHPYRRGKSPAHQKIWLNSQVQGCCTEKTVPAGQEIDKVG